MSRYSSEHALAVAQELRDDVMGASDREVDKIEEAANVIVGLVADRDDAAERLANVQGAAVAMNEAINRARTLRPLSAWTDDAGPVLWVDWPITATPWCGTPVDPDWRDGLAYFLPLPDLQAVFLPPGDASFIETAGKRER